MVQKEHYTFGDSDLAATRLRLLARVFEPGSAALLARLADAGGALALDFGCGPGYTTGLVAAHVGSERVIGLDQSPRLLEQARRERESSRMSFVCCDISLAPLPVPAADVLYSRFVLTHLRDPASVVRAWAAAAKPDARLVLEETASMSCEHPVFGRYYALVERMQAHYGQRMYIGRELEALARSPGWRVECAEVAQSLLPAVDMAELHLLNLQTWGSDAFARENYGEELISELSAELREVASGATAAPPVSLGMGQVVLRRS
jgi:ubiquinone/menaquinone biosynthesis C-methylase UbiE